MTPKQLIQQAKKEDEMNEYINVHELKYQVEQTGSNFFDRESMRFFGDTMKNYGCRAAEVTSNYDENDNYVENGGIVIKVWELYRRRPVKHGLQKSAYFDRVTFRRVYPAINQKKEG